MIQAIVFDLGGVLFTNGTTLFAKHIAATHKKDQEEVYKLLNYSDFGNAYREGKITGEEFYNSLKKELDLDDDIHELKQKWLEVYQVIEGTKKIIEELRKKYKVYFLSDNVKERVEYAHRRYGFLNWFDGGVFSHEVGVRKPNLKIYETAIVQIGLKPEEIVFIDDKEINLPPAEKIGMKTILYKNPEQLKKELHKMKLL